MKRTVPRTLIALGTIVVLFASESPALPYPQADVTPEDDAVLEIGEPDSGGLVLPDRRANVRDRAPAERQRIISLDAVPEATVEPGASRSRWKWLAIGAGAAGVFVAAYLVQGHTGVIVPGPRSGGPLSAAPMASHRPAGLDVATEPVAADARSGTGNR